MATAADLRSEAKSLLMRPRPSLISETWKHLL